MKLIFDADAMIEDLKIILIEVMDELNDDFYKEAIRGMTFEGIASSEKIPAEISINSSGNFGEGDTFIVAKCKFYAQAILDSFGVGKYADTTSKYWEDYTKSIYYNPERAARNTTDILGRPKGTYTDIFGKTRESSGKSSGKPLPDPLRFNDGTVLQSKPGSHSIQLAEAYVMQNGKTRIERRIEMEIEKFFNEVAMNPKRYFKIVGG